MINLEYLKNQRVNKGLSLQDVSGALGYSTPNGYWKIEQGITKLKAEQLWKLKAVLDIDLNLLISR